MTKIAHAKIDPQQKVIVFKQSCWYCGFKHRVKRTIDHIYILHKSEPEQGENEIFNLCKYKELLTNSSQHSIF